MSSPSIRFGRYREVADQVAADIAAARRAEPRAGVAAALGEPLEVVIASRGVAEAIAARLLESFPEGFGGVTLQTVDTLARRVLNAAGDFPRVADDGERRLAMRTAVRRRSDPLFQTRGMPAMLERSYRDVRDSGLSLGDLEERLRGRRALRNGRRLETFIRVWKEYERLIAAIEAIDPAELLLRAVALIEKTPALVRPQIAAGFYDATGVQWMLFSALAGAGRLASIHVPVPERSERQGRAERSYAFADRLVESLLALGGAGETGSPRRGEPHAAAAADVRIDIAEAATEHDELRGVCGAIRELLDRGAALVEIGIVSRSIDPFDAELIDRFSRQSGFCVTRRAATPLRAHRIGRAMATLLRLREENFPRGAVIEVLRCGMHLTTRVSARSVDRATRVCGIAGGTSGELRRARVKASQASTIEDYIAAVAEMESIIAPVGEPIGGPQWAQWLTSVLSLFSMTTESDIAAAEEVERIAQMLRRTAGAKSRFDAGAILDAIEQAEVAPLQPETPSIWYGDVMRMRGRSFRHLFAIRMQDDLFPQRRTDDPLLPDRDRQQLGIREVGNGLDEEQLLFQLILDSATESLRFSYAATDAVGKLLRPSQLVKNLALERDRKNAPAILQNFSRYLSGASTAGRDARPRPEERMLSPDPVIARKLQLAVMSGSGSAFDGYLAPAALLDEAIGRALAQVSPTQLEEFGECPQKFLLKSILDVREIDDPERQIQINARDKGSIDHRILERFYRTLTAQELAEVAASLPAVSAKLFRRLDDIIGEEFAAFAAEHPPFNATLREIERRNTADNLRAFLAADFADLVAAGLTPRFFEWRFGPRHREETEVDHPEPFRIESEHVALAISGTIDRIDAGGRAWRILDYKSGKGGRHKKLGDKIDRGAKLQLALYAMAVARFFDADPKLVSAAIRPLAVSDTRPESFAFTLADKEESLREVLALFIRSISRGRFPAFPNSSDDGACRYCPVNLSCRTLHDAEESYALGRIGGPKELLEMIEAKS